jgi:hypothetical protein
MIYVSFCQHFDVDIACLCGKLLNKFLSAFEANLGLSHH